MPAFLRAARFVQSIASVFVIFRLGGFVAGLAALVGAISGNPIFAGLAALAWLLPAALAIGVLLNLRVPLGALGVAGVGLWLAVYWPRGARSAHLGGRLRDRVRVLVAVALLLHLAAEVREDFIGGHRPHRADGLAGVIHRGGKALAFIDARHLPRELV